MILVAHSLRTRAVFDNVFMRFMSLLLGVITLFAVGIVEESLLASIVIALLLGGIGVLLIILENGMRVPVQLLRQFWVTYGFRIFVMGMLHIMLKVSVDQPFWGFGPNGGDEKTFYDGAEKLLLAWQNGSILTISPIWSEAPAFAWFQIVGFFRFAGFALNGDTIFNIKLVSCASSALIVPYVYMLAIRVYNAKIARLAALLVFLLPDYWFYASTLMRDVFVSLVIVVLFYQAFQLVYNSFSWQRLFFFVFLNFWIIRYLRPEMTFIILITIIISFVWSKYRLTKGFLNRFKWIVLLGIIAVVAIKIFSPQYYSNLLTILSSEHIQHRMNINTVTAIEQASSGSLGAMILKLPAILRIPLSTIYLLIQPIPPWGSFLARENVLRNGVEVFAGFFWWAVVVFLPIGLIASFRKDIRKTFWIWGPAIMFAVSLSVSSGIQPRWRLMLMPFLLILIALGIVVGKRYPVSFYLSVLFICSVLGLYLLIKYLLPTLGIQGIVTIFGPVILMLMLFMWNSFQTRKKGVN